LQQENCDLRRQAAKLTVVQINTGSPETDTIAELGLGKVVRPTRASWSAAKSQ